MDLVHLIKKHLSTIGLHDETFDEYIAGIITDDSLEESEKREAISEFISGATDTSSETIIDDIFKAWVEFKEEEQKIKETEKQEKEAKESDALQNSDISMSTESTSMSLRSPKKQLTKVERKKREQLLARYSYDLDEVVENEYGEAEIQYKDRSETKEINNDLLQANRNAEQVKQKEQSQREQMKKKHEDEKERNRKLLEKQQHDKEKAKKKTMKREKRSW